MLRVTCCACGTVIRSLSYPSQEATKARREREVECPTCQKPRAVNAALLRPGLPQYALSMLPDDEGT